MLHTHRECEYIINLITYSASKLCIVWPSAFGFLPETCAPNEASNVFPCYSKSAVLTERDLQMGNGSCTRVRGDGIKAAFHF